MKCFICKSEENLVSGFPRNKTTLKEWKKILNIGDKSALQDKKLCIKHFDTKFHKILLDKNSIRGRYIFPLPYNESETAGTSTESCKRPLECLDKSPESNQNKKRVNYELIIKIKDAEIVELKNQVRELQSQNLTLKKQLDKAESLPSTIKRALEVSSKLCNSSKILVNLLLTGKKGHIYSEEEKLFCQNFYFKHPSAFKFLKNILGPGLPSPRTLIRWQSFKQFNVGIIKEIMCHLKSISGQLTDEEREVTLILDEMDGKRGLRYCKTRDMVIGYEHLLERTQKLAKKFLAFMIRGLNPKLGNFVFASFATEKGVTGKFIII